MKLSLTIDELTAIGALLLSLVFWQYPIFNTICAVAAIYLFICVFFRKYEDAQRRLRK